MDAIWQAYEEMAAQYIELFGSSAHMHPEDLALITQHLSIHPGVVLDVGCGPGHLTEHMRLLGVDACGIDPVPQFIDHARTTYPHGRYELGSFDDLPLAHGSAAGVLAWYSLIHLHRAELANALGELRRVMATGGVLVTGFFDGDEVECFDHAVAPAYYWPVDELSTHLVEAGFVEIERCRRPGLRKTGCRPHGALVAIAH